MDITHQSDEDKKERDAVLLEHSVVIDSGAGDGDKSSRTRTGIALRLRELCFRR